MRVPCGEQVRSRFALCGDFLLTVLWQRMLRCASRRLALAVRRPTRYASTTASAEAPGSGPQATNKALIVVGVAAGLTVALATLMYTRQSRKDKKTKLEELKMAWDDETAAAGPDVVLSEQGFLEAMLKDLPSVADQALEEGWVRSIFRPNNVRTACFCAGQSTR